jgi:subtilisin family serine protease
MSGIQPQERYTFVFRSGAKPERIREAGGTVHFIGKYTPIVTASFNRASQVDRLRNDPELISIQEDRSLKLPYYKVERIFSASQALKNSQNVSKQIFTWNIARVIGQRRPNSGIGVRVGVIDTGIDFYHPDLRANIKGGINVLSPNALPLDDNGHGSHIAGVIGALNNHFGVVGIAPKVSLYAIKVLNAVGKGNFSDLVKGIEWAIDNRMHILNISISGGQTIPTALLQAIQAAVSRGIIIVAAAGNTGNAKGKGDTVSVPARISHVMSVAALNRANQREYYSATGKVDIAAPGSQILSTYSSRRYAILSGTSMAAAHVSGALAILRVAHPHAKVKVLKGILFRRALDLPPAGKDPLTGVGLVRIFS